jgi:hypothetical protein
MHAESASKGVVGFLACAFGNWERKRKRLRQDRRRFGDLAGYEVARMARDVGLSSFDLCEMVRLGPDASESLTRRMAALHIDIDKVSQTNAGLLRDMQRLCATCGNKGRCDMHLVVDSENPVWRRYCPNERFLAELQSENVGGI